MKIFKKMFSNPVNKETYIFYIIGHHANYTLQLYVTPLVALFVLSIYDYWLTYRIILKLKEIKNPLHHDTYN